jgi:hypothetical protein
MAKRLLDRQVSLLHYLTSSGAIFDGGDDRLAPALQGIDRGLLQLEARFSYEKRMEKIAGVFPRALALLADERESVFKEFARACPPVSIGRLENARQFFDLLSARWRDEPPPTAFLPDVASCELAIATCRVAAENEQASVDEPGKEALPRSIRRNPAVVLQRCAHDIRPLFESASEAIIPERRETHLAVIAPSGANPRGIFELAPAVFDLLAALDEWVDIATLGAPEEANELVADLESAGLIEVRR